MVLEEVTRLQLIGIVDLDVPQEPLDVSGSIPNVVVEFLRNLVKEPWEEVGLWKDRRDHF